MRRTYSNASASQGFNFSPGTFLEISLVMSSIAKIGVDQDDCDIRHCTVWLMAQCKKKLKQWHKTTTPFDKLSLSGPVCVCIFSRWKLGEGRGFWEDYVTLYA
jgi:hypothetical protein